MKTCVRIRPACLALCLVLAAGGFAGCNGGGDDSEPPIGPDLNGDWAGKFFVARSTDRNEQPVSATIRHNGNAVTIRTSLVGIGARLTGSINLDGRMTLTDAFDGETWTTFFRNATLERVQVADFLFDEDLGGDSPLNVIDLRRTLVAAPAETGTEAE